MQKARKLETKKDEIMSEIYNLLEQLHVDISVSTKAENADNLDEAIQCCINYNEYSVKGIMNEIKEQLKE
jgi:hypothetical protein